MIIIIIITLSFSLLLTSEVEPAGLSLLLNLGFLCVVCFSELICLRVCFFVYFHL